MLLYPLLLHQCDFRHLILKVGISSANYLAQSLEDIKPCRYAPRSVRYGRFMC